MEVRSFFIYGILFAVIIVDVAFSSRDFYKILGVSKTAKTQEIKRAFRKLAKDNHPDKNKDDPNAENVFRDISAAYEVLSDPDKRKTYDRYGEEGLKQGDTGGDPFAQFFGDFGMFGGGGHHEPDTPTGGTVIMDLWVSLEEMYTGNFVEVVRSKPVAKAAGGTRKCNCRQEMRTKPLGPGRFQMIQEQVCDDCPNVRFVTEDKTLEIEIEPGVPDFQEYPLIAEGEPHIDGEPGDLKFIIRQKQHPIFTRRENDLYMNMTISLLDSLVGFETTFKHLDGHKVTIKREKPLKPGAIMKKKNEGMPHYVDSTKRGQLYITFDVSYPKRDISEEEKETLRKLFEQDHVKPKAYNGLR